MYNGQEMQQNSTANSMMAFLLGAVVGATAMLLYAPASGREVRSRIVEKATDIKDRAGEWTGQAADKAAEWKEMAMSTVQETLDKASETFKGADGKSPAAQFKQAARV